MSDERVKILEENLKRLKEASNQAELILEKKTMQRITIGDLDFTAIR